MLIFCYICLHNAGIKTTRHKLWREIISYKKSYKYENIQRYIFALILNKHKNCHKVLNCSLCMFPVSRGWTLETSLDNASTDLFWERAKARFAESSNDGSRIPGTPRMQSLPRLPGKWGTQNKSNRPGQFVWPAKLHVHFFLKLAWLRWPEAM